MTSFLRNLSGVLGAKREKAITELLPMESNEYLVGELND